MIVIGLVRQLKAQTSVTDGQFGVDQQIWPGSAPQQHIYPRVILNKISGDEDTHQGGAISLGRARVTVTCFARQYAQAANIIKNCVDYLNGLREPEVVAMLRGGEGQARH